MDKNNAKTLQVAGLDLERSGVLLQKGLNFALKPGQILQVLGANGAGKSTLLRTLSGLLPYAQGAISWGGRLVSNDFHHYQQQILYISDKPSLKENLTVAENLQQDCALARVQGNIADMARILGLAQQLESQGGKLSTGQRRRLGLGPLLLATQPLWILDEPFLALDHEMVFWLQQQLLAHVAIGGLVIFTSHQAIALGEGAITSLTLH